MWKAKRGAGTLIAAAFMTLILLSGFTVFFLIKTEAEDFQSTLESMNRLDWEQSQEKAKIYDAYWYPEANPDKLNVTVENTGSIEIQLQYIGVFNESNNQALNNTMPYQPIEPYVLVNPGERRTIGPYTTFNYEENITIELITTRGNVFNERSIPEPPGIPEFWSTTGLGYVTITFEPDSFQYTSNTVSEPTPAWVIPSETLADPSEAIWWIKLKSHSNTTITLTKWSWLELADYHTATPTITNYYIVDPGSNNADGLIAYGPEAANAPQILEPPSCALTGECTKSQLVEGGPPITVKFASKKISPDIEFQTGTITKGHYNLFIMLYYRFGDDSTIYGQIIPFAGIIVE
ncbi:MAG: hypothetical protein GTN80_09075 [Nitrososphaeria archaeon]|nr:hypothetical protein [Nitrososphaeria archaeon]NIN53318.1 hypothetical protein [Nitrososphaeria archaeon]NIQ33771.1 hypothetical protein [Nitrososphaeria archaeon]